MTASVALLLCLVLLALQSSCGASSIVRQHRRLLQPEQLEGPHTLQNSSGLTASWVAHQCLWTAPTIASAVAVASATATGGGGASASATAVATATASSSSITSPAGTCSLNPSFFFSLTEAGKGPDSDQQKLLLQVTAMRYSCLNHTGEAACFGDQANWCLWQDKDSKGHCELFFGDADFVHFLLWAGTQLACSGSKLSQIVSCSFKVSQEECAAATGCAWTEGACYPSAFYAPIITKPKMLAKFKHQVQMADPEVWGDCISTEIYRQYSAICNHQTQDACKKDAAACIWVAEYDAEVAANPLNFTKPCILSSRSFPLESVFLGNPASPFASAIMQAQTGCTSSRSEASCKASTTTINSNVLVTALNYRAASVNRSATAAANASAAASKPWAVATASASASAGSTFTASWGLPVAGAFKAEQEPDKPAAASASVPASTPPPAAAPLESPVQANSMPAPGPLAAPHQAAGGGLAQAAGAATSATASASSSAAGVVTAASSFKNPGAWLKPIASSEILFGIGDLFGAAEFSPSKANTPGTKAALSSLKILLRLPARRV